MRSTQFIFTALLLKTTSSELHNGPDKPHDPTDLTLEAWSQGLMVGSLFFMALLTVANTRSGVLLHKLILVELIIAIPNGLFIFFESPQYGWYLSFTAIGMISSWTLHNVIAWLKSRPFLSKTVSLLYIDTVILAQGYWILEIYANFTYFNGGDSSLFLKTRPFEGPCRDPWWIFTTVNLFWNIKRHYEFTFVGLVKASPRFGVLLFSMCLSVCFIIIDILSVTALDFGGINPFWKFAFVFKCFTDTVFLDDFKTVLDRLWRQKMEGVWTVELSHPPKATGPCHVEDESP